MSAREPKVAVEVATYETADGKWSYLVKIGRETKEIRGGFSSSAEAHRAARRRHVRPGSTAIIRPACSA